jgi:hypothetical protein
LMMMTHATATTTKKMAEAGVVVGGAVGEAVAGVAEQSNCLSS